MAAKARTQADDATAAPAARTTAPEPAQVSGAGLTIYLYCEADEPIFIKRAPSAEMLQKTTEQHCGLQSLLHKQGHQLARYTLFLQC